MPVHGEFPSLRLIFLQAHRETEAHFTAAGMSSQNTNSEALRFKRAAFYNGLKSKVGLAAAKAAAPRTPTVTAMDSGTRITGGGSGYAAILAHAEGVLYGMELGSVTLKRIGFFCFPIKHSTREGGNDR